MPIAKVSRIKNVSAHRRWEWVRHHGYHIPGADGEHLCLKGQELDEYVNEQVWREAHPGQETSVEVEVP